MREPLNAFELLAIEERINRASCGPWFHKSTSVLADLEPGRSLYKIAHAYEAGTPEQFRAGHGNCVDNAEFIAHAREDIPRLIATVTTLRGALSRYGVHLDGCPWWEDEDSLMPCTCGLDGAKAIGGPLPSEANA